MSDFSNRVALVTGASRGIGRAVAEGLAAAGAHVIAVARTVGGLEELDDAVKAKGGSTTLVPLDMKDYAGIDRLGAAIHERWGKLDMLVGNAGILGVITPVSHLDPKIFEDVMAVNVTANYRLIRSLDPLLRASDAGRSLFMTSGVTKVYLPYWGVYSASKAALEALVRTYAAELGPSRATANLFNPGPLRTKMRAQSAPGERPDAQKPPEVVVPEVLKMLAPDYTKCGVLYDFPTDRTERLLRA